MMLRVYFTTGRHATVMTNHYMSLAEAFRFARESYPHRVVQSVQMDLNVFRIIHKFLENDLIDLELFRDDLENGNGEIDHWLVTAGFISDYEFREICIEYFAVIDNKEA